MHFTERESLLLAPYAMHSAASAGRARHEAAHAYRSPYQRDRDRIVHCSAYRRLGHKTQVFTGELGDYHRSRLTHTMEVASLARTMARVLAVNEDLVEALALGHDIGHPPFGHAGEHVLNERLAAHGGFNHNAQAVRIFELLEQRYVDFPGLNLTHEVLEGQRHRVRKPPSRPDSASGDQPRMAPDRSSPTPLIEVQVVDAADSIAYDAHDADDALELGMLELGDLREVPMWNEAAGRVERRHAALSPAQFRRAVIHELLDWLVGDLLRVARRRLAELGLQSAQESQRAPIVATASPEVAQQKAELERFLFQRVYRHPRVQEHRDEAGAALASLFDRVLAAPEALPAPYAQIARSDSPERAAADFVSSVTDRYALEAYRVGGRR